MTSTGQRMQFPFPLAGRRPGRFPALSTLEPGYLVSNQTLRFLSGLPGGTREMRQVAGSTLSGLIGQAIAREKGLSGLLDDYLNDWEAFKERFNPGTVRPGLTPPTPIRQAEPETPRPLRMPIPGGPPVERTPIATPGPVLPCPGPTAAPVGPVGLNEYPLQDEQAKAKDAWEEAKKKGDQKDMEEAYRKYKEAFDKNQEETPLRAYMEQLARKIEDETLNHPDSSDYGYKEAQERIKATQEQMEGLWPGWYKAHLDWMVWKATGCAAPVVSGSERHRFHGPRHRAPGRSRHLPIPGMRPGWLTVRRCRPREERPERRSQPPAALRSQSRRCLQAG